MIHNTFAKEEIGTLAAISINALIHDLVEMRSGDFVRTFKYKTTELKEAVDDAEELVKAEFDLHVQRLYSTAAHLITDGNKEYVKTVIKAADFLSLYHYMAREIYRSNYEITPFFDRMVEDLTEMKLKSKVVFCYNTPVDFQGFYQTLVERAVDLISVVPTAIRKHTKRTV
jgi:5'-deoxynucleotidase YfbR-like HD superfamily hydrolase